jgi:hypothetical protein
MLLLLLDDDDDDDDTAIILLVLELMQNLDETMCVCTHMHHDKITIMMDVL